MLSGQADAADVATGYIRLHQVWFCVFSGTVKLSLLAGKASATCTMLHHIWFSVSGTAFQHYIRFSQASRTPTL